MSFRQQSSKPDLKNLSEQIIAFRKENKTFEKSVQQRPIDNSYRFYDGPPFITGLPHYGSLLSGICKDVIPRFQTMKGKRVERTRGWDCHGLPIEQKVQKQFGLENNDDIEKFGVQRFIDECYHYTHATVGPRQRYVEQSGRWVDMDHAYRTMDNNYMESVMRVFKQLRDKGLVYKGKRVSLYSTKLCTPISNFEVAMDDTYEDINDPAITVAFDLSENGAPWVNTFVLARTTTPWTIPTNMALAVNQEKNYSKVSYDGKYYIVASGRVEAIFAGKAHEVVEEFTGDRLVWLSYNPPYDFYKNKTNNPADHKIYHADFITDTDGTGIGHEAPEFGDVDFQLAQQVGITISEAMDRAGCYTSQIPPFEGLFYRDQNEPIMAELAAKGVLFAKQSITHRVAFDPRSGTPLVYKAQESRFIDVASLKNKLLAENEKINWFPEHFKYGRFAKSIEMAPDRCISRTRYRGTPMPVYVSSDGDSKIIGSREEIFEHNKPLKQLTKIIFVRHGRTDFNDKNCHDCENKAQLSVLGREQAELFAAKFADTQIDAVYSSPYQRCLDTIEPLLTAKGLQVTTDDRIVEISAPSFQGQFFACDTLKWDGDGINGSESAQDVYKRVSAFLDEVLEKHAGQTIVICSHKDPLALMTKHIYDYNYDTDKSKRALTNKSRDIPNRREEYIVTDTKKRLDLHRPVIDGIKLSIEGKIYQRIPEVLDVWLDSASMPYAQLHYPFENQVEFDAGFPADYIVEYTGQIRAWFYVMHVIGVALFDKPAYTNVVTTGVLAGNDGRKMSKSYGNYPDPKESFEQYGGDAIRMFLINSPVVAGGDLAVSEEWFAETLRQAVLPLRNAFSFFTTYARIDGLSYSDVQVSVQDIKSYDFLDRWIVAEFHTMLQTVDSKLEGYDMQKAAGALVDFFDLLTNRYIRRSRRRFRKSENDGDKWQAYRTLSYVLVELSKVSAPFMPLISEYIYKELTGEESVHLQDRPTYRNDLVDESLLTAMRQVKEAVSLGLARRARRNLRVRQPLQSVTIGLELGEEFRAIIADELNVKQVLIDAAINTSVTKICKPNGRTIGPKFGKNVQTIIQMAKSGNYTQLDDGRVQVGERVLDADDYEISYIKTDESFDGEVANGIVVVLDDTLTPELLMEGNVRDLVRHIQEARKTAGYDISDRISLRIDDADMTDGLDVSAMLQQFGSFIQAETLSTIVDALPEVDLQQTVAVAGGNVTFGIKR